MDNVAIGAKLHKLRKKLGYTTTSLAKKVGVSQAQISRLENGKQGFRSATLTRISKSLGVKPVFFFLEESDTGEARIAERLASYGVTPSKRLVEALSRPGFRKWVERAADAFEGDRARFQAAAKAFNAKTKKRKKK